MNYSAHNTDNKTPASGANHEAESLRLEAVTTCVGFDDILDVTLALNHPHLDTMIVVTTQNDRATQLVAKKHGAVCVETDLFHKNGRNFNKGAAINAGMDRFQYHGWRLHLDGDIVLPDNFRRMLFNHTHLSRACLYGADRVDVVGRGALALLREAALVEPQHAWSCLLSSRHNAPPSPRYVDSLRGYCPLGFFQLWHAICQKPYPYSLGTAAHDDIMFCDGWAASHRAHLPTVLCYHLCATAPQWGENWDGVRKQPAW
jgi:hypothetical protein